jgi:hypothetical protein
LCIPVLFFIQRVDISAITHDHGRDVTKAVRLSGMHSFLCIDHELDLTVNAGIDSPGFAATFTTASTLVNLIRGSPNIYRRLKDEQV